MFCACFVALCLFPSLLCVYVIIVVRVVIVWLVRAFVPYVLPCVGVFCVRFVALCMVCYELSFCLGVTLIVCVLLCVFISS